MTWFKVDDGFWAHPKCVAAPPAALALWVRAGSWSASQLTDGAVPRVVLGMLGGKTRDAAALVDVGLWEETDAGWRFHGWDATNPRARRSRPSGMQPPCASAHGVRNAEVTPLVTALHRRS
jgi:hypothetical protein